MGPDGAGRRTGTKAVRRAEAWAVRRGVEAWAVRRGVEGRRVGAEARIVGRPMRPGVAEPVAVEPRRDPAATEFGFEGG